MAKVKIQVKKSNKAISMENAPKAKQKAFMAAGAKEREATLKQSHETAQYYLKQKPKKP